MAARGDGMFLFDADDHAYLDMSGGAAVSLLGHQHPEVIAQVKAQLDRLAYAHTAFFTNERQERLAARLAQRFPGPGARVYFTSGGSEANETAVKMAWQFWRAMGKPDKKMVISREHSYHGNTFLTLSLSGNRLRRQASAAPLLDWPRIAACYPYRERGAAESDHDYGLRSARELAVAVETAGSDNVAAFICEPVVGASLGAVPAVAGYLREIRRICDEHEILLILDEVMCGSGRTGSYFAFEAEGMCPDIVTLGKGISGGYQPLAAVMINERVASTLSEYGFAHGFTYIGHAAALAAGCAVQDVIDNEGLLAQIGSRGSMCLAALLERLGSHPKVGDVRGRGLLMGIELVDDRDSKGGFAQPLAEAIRLRARDSGLICYPGEILLDSGYVPHILLAPPAMVEQQHMVRCCEILEKVIAEICMSRPR